jgi:hypothetical protein
MIIDGSDSPIQDHLYTVRAKPMWMSVDNHKQRHALLNLVYNFFKNEKLCTCYTHYFFSRIFMKNGGIMPVVCLNSTYTQPLLLQRSYVY